MSRRKSRIAAASVFAIVALSGCGKSVDLGAADSPQKASPPAAPRCGPGHTGRWQFTQPDPVDRRVVDLLFVVDTSASMDPKRARIADAIPAFVSGLKAGTDYRIGVMLAHGGASRDSGRLYSNPGIPEVLSSANLSSSEIQSALRTNLRYVDEDADEAEGEAGLYSVMRSLGADRLPEIQALGFYRPEAALSVVFVTDENDICYPPERNGYSQFPDFVPSIGGIEAIGYEKYCRAPGQTASNFPSTVYSRLSDFKMGRPFAPAGIVHLDPLKVPRGDGIEDSIGHGIIETVGRSANGVLIDIADASYSAGLARLGNVVQTTLELQTLFGLSGDSRVDASSVQVYVDGVAVGSSFDPSSRTVQIRAADAGQSRSVVRIEACLL